MELQYLSPPVNAAGAHLVVFNVFLILSFRIAVSTQATSICLLLSRRVLRIAAVCTVEVLSQINQSSQSGIEPETSDSLTFVLTTRPPRSPKLRF